MLPIFIRYLFTCLCCHYSYSKTAKMFTNPFVSFLFISLLCSIIATLSNHTAMLRICLMYLIMLAYYFIVSKQKFSFVFISLSISSGLSFVFLAISCIVNSIIFVSIYKSATNIPYEIADIFIGILQFLLTYLIFKVRRFKNGLRVLIKHNAIKILSLTCAFIIAYTAIISTISDAGTRRFRYMKNAIIILLSIFVLFYWRHRITQTYREKLRLANEKSLEDELNKQKETIANLEADNARLSQIVHKDNKIILAMLTAVTEHLENATNATPDEQIIRGKELSAQLHDMANERQGILNTQSKLPNALPKSGLHTVDGMLSFMERRAKEAGITYKLQLEENIKELVSNSIEEADLLHMLGDLIENSLIATKHTNNEKEILIHLGSLQGHFLLEISDSGIPFSLETYQRFGNEQHTTHSEDGGSGIGLMDIWKLKKKYKASLHIYEYEDNEGIYTKKLAFIFDRKNHFLLQTPRYKEATYALTRGDLYIFSNKEE